MPQAQHQAPPPNPNSANPVPWPVRERLQGERVGTICGYYLMPPDGYLLSVTIDGVGHAWMRREKLAEAVTYGIVGDLGRRIGVTYVLQGDFHYIMDFRVIPDSEQSPATHLVNGDGGS